MAKGGKSKGAGNWVFVKKGGKGFKGGKGGKGKGFRRNIGMVRRAAKTQAEKVVWIGGLKERESFKDAELNKKLQEWINKLAEGCKFVDIGPKGSGGAIFGTDDEASAAISTLNGKKFQGCKLEFDTYVKGWTADE